MLLRLGTFFLGPLPFVWFLALGSWYLPPQARAFASASFNSASAFGNPLLRAARAAAIAFW
jgi:hypothetical protein